MQEVAWVARHERTNPTTPVEEARRNVSGRRFLVRGRGASRIFRSEGCTDEVGHAIYFPLVFLSLRFTARQLCPSDKSYEYSGKRRPRRARRVWRRNGPLCCGPCAPRPLSCRGGHPHDERSEEGGSAERRIRRGERQTKHCTVAGKGRHEPSLSEGRRHRCWENEGGAWWASCTTGQRRY